MNREREKIRSEIAETEHELAEARRERSRIIKRMGEITDKGAPKQMITRYALELKDQINVINNLNERLHMLNALLVDGDGR